MMEHLNNELLDLSPERKVLVDSTAVTRKAKPGDHIAIPFGGSWVEGVYCGLWHHGIYVGFNDDDEPVAIDMSGRTDEEANIREVTLNKFRGDESTFVIVTYENDTDAKREASLKKARLALDTFKDHPADLYDRIGSNCEHFATCCRNGRSVSENYCKVQAIEVPLLKVFSSPHCCMKGGIRSKSARFRGSWQKS